MIDEMADDCLERQRQIIREQAKRIAELERESADFERCMMAQLTLRHGLAEFYCPDWIAIVMRVVRRRAERTALVEPSPPPPED